MRTKLFTVILGSIGGLMAFPNEEVPCLIFSGNAEKEIVLDLKEFNRISFDDTYMFVSNSQHPQNIMELPYSNYNRFRIGNEVVSGLSERKAVVSENLFYDKISDCLLLYSSTENCYKVEIFKNNGVKVAYATMKGGQSVSLEALEPGIYIATAGDSQDKIQIKFIK